MERLQTKLEAVEATNSELTQQVTSLRQSVGPGANERGDLLARNERSNDEIKKALENLHDDQKAELDTFKQSRYITCTHTHTHTHAPSHSHTLTLSHRADINEMFTATQKSFDTEQRLRLQVLSCDQVQYHVTVTVCVVMRPPPTG